MKALIRKLLNTLDRHDVALDPSFNPPATKRQINAAENRLSVSFPKDLRSFLTTVNGQSDPERAVVEGDVIIPRLSFGKRNEHLAAEGWFADVDTIVELTLHDREFRDARPISKTKRWGPVRSNQGFICITKSETPWWLAVDLEPDEGGDVGQVVSVNEYPEQTVVIASSLSELIQRLIDGFASNAYHVDDEGYLSET